MFRAAMKRCGRSVSVQFCDVRLLAPDDRLHAPGLGEAEVLHPDVVVVVPVHVVNTQVHRHHTTRPLISQLHAYWREAQSNRFKKPGQNC